MTSHFLQACRVVVRVVAIVNLGSFGLLLINQQLSHSVANAPFHGALMDWEIGTSGLLPLLVVLEFWGARRSGTAKGPLWIDAILAAAWFFLLWGSVFYAFGHHAII